MLIAIAAVAALLGYAQWRRQSILRTERELNAIGFTLLWQDRRTHWIWPVIPKEAAFDLKEIDANTVEIMGKEYSPDDANLYYGSRIWRLHELRIEYCRLMKDGTPTDTATTTISPSPRK
jgi:hypothetical protein